MSTYSKAKRGVPPAMFRAMGFLIGATSSADYLLASLILRLVGNAHGISVGHGDPLVAGMEIKTKISMIRIFLKMFDLDEDQRMNKLLDQISSMVDSSYEIAHSVVQQDGNGPLKFQDLRAAAQARTELGSLMAQARAGNPPPRSTKRRTQRKPPSSKEERLRGRQCPIQGATPDAIFWACFVTVIIPKVCLRTLSASRQKWNSAGPRPLSICFRT